MKEFLISKNDAEVRLDKFMMRVMPASKPGDIYKALRKKKVRVNGKHKNGEYRLKTDDTVAMYISDEFFESEKKSFSWLDIKAEVNVVYEDENILIADKPSGLMSQEEGDSLESRVRSYLYKKGEVDLDAVPLFIPSLCHRIDRNTRGLLIAAKNSSALRILNEKIKNREIRKFYLCETEKAPSQKKGIIEGFLLKDERTRKMSFYKNEVKGSSYCKSEYKTLKTGETNLLEVELLTGKTHQIRASLLYMGCPLLGDVKYGAEKNGERDFQHLTAYKIFFDFKTDAGILEYLKGKEITL